MAKDTRVSYNLNYSRRSSASLSSSPTRFLKFKKLTFPTMMSILKYYFLKLCILLLKMAFVSLSVVATVLSNARSVGIVISSSRRSLSSLSSPLDLKKLVWPLFRRRSSNF